MTQYRRVTDADLEALCRILSQSFAADEKLVPRWLERAGLENVRLLEEERPEAALFVVPMGQWWGGRSLSNLGIAGVGVRPESRSRGLASSLMQSALSEAYDRGFALSALYPATRTVYRKAGYELGGVYCRAKLRLEGLKTNRSTLRVREMHGEDHERVRELARTLRTENGNLDRGEYVWARIKAPLFKEAAAYVFEAKDGAIEGYVFLRSIAPEPGRFDLQMSDYGCASPAALDALVGFLAGHRSLGRSVEWTTGPSDPILMALPEYPYTLSIDLHWMLRIVHLETALTGRGYAAGPEAEICFELDDDVIPANSGCHRLKIGGGRARLEPGERPELKLSPTGLAALFSGTRSARSLALHPGVHGELPALERAAAIFSGGSPWMGQMF